ncbi:MAG: cell division protein FtsA [Prevotellaceae bacterium]|jgi:cell division protein FtsA|nr:cell division protein FtsA [Prevotellaceae bacterium]
MNGKRIIAIDVGSSRITLMAAEVTSAAQVRVFAAEENRKSGISRSGIIEQVSGVAFQISELSKKLRNSLHLEADIYSIYISVNAKTMKSISHTITRTFRRYTEVKFELLEEMEMECRTLFEEDDVEVYEIIPSDYRIDNKRNNDPVGQKCYSLQATYNVIIGNKKIIENINRCFDRTGIIRQEYVPLSMEALANAVLTQEECEDGVALLNFGATTTTLALYVNGMLENLMVVPRGGYHITKDIQELGISERDAEKLKRLKGVAMEKMVEKAEKIIVAPAHPDNDDVKIATPFLAHIIEAQLDETLLPIFGELEKNKSKIGAGIVLAGGGSNLNGILEFIQQRTDMITRFGDHFDKLTEDTHEAFADPVYAQLIGTCLLIDNYLHENPDKIDPAEEKKPKIGLRKKLAQKFMIFFDDKNDM